MELLFKEFSFESLIEEYKKSLAPILSKRNEIRKKIDYLQHLKETDIATGEGVFLKQQILFINNQQQLLKAEDRFYSEMQGDLEFAITWMKSGHAPGITRGIERRSVYQNTKPVDPILMQKYFRSTHTPWGWDIEVNEYVVTPSEKQVIDKAMAILTERELEVFFM